MRQHDRLVPWLGGPARAFTAASRSCGRAAARHALGRDAQATLIPHVTLLAVLLLMAADAVPQSPDARPAAFPVASPATTQPVHFSTVDVRIDPKSTPLAAYQLEFIADPARVKLVGIEGGDHTAYREPPYYDPAALNRNRVILAAFNTSSDLPKSEFRVARLHLQITGGGEPLRKHQVRLIIASAADGSAVPGAAATVSEGAIP